MATYRAFVEQNDEKLYAVTYYHKPQRWYDNRIEENDPILNVNNWSEEIKYLNNSHNEVSTGINNLPDNKGGIYIFYIKGICLPFIENYILYVGRCQHTKNQNLRKRAKEYFSDKRPLIRGLFDKWKEHIYYRFYPDENNNRICLNETKLIRTILPPYNDSIPDNIDVQPTIPAFQLIKHEKNSCN
jgi:hypothetical protein